jgi:hypothetical protein
LQFADQSVEAFLLYRRTNRLPFCDLGILEKLEPAPVRPQPFPTPTAMSRLSPGPQIANPDPIDTLLDPDFGVLAVI